MLVPSREGKLLLVSSICWKLRRKKAFVRLMTPHSISRAVLICSNRKTMKGKHLQLESYIIKLTIIHCHFPRFIYPWQDKPQKKACELEQSLLGFPKYLMLTLISMILIRMPFLFWFIISAGNRKCRDILLSLPAMISLLPLIKGTKRGR